MTPELSGNAPPYAREMVLLHIRGVYRQQILLEEMVQPTLANFSWTQLGRDRWSRTRLPDGQTALALERVIAIFPHHAGDFTIEPFVHRVTVNDNGARRLVEVASPAVSLPVARWTKETGGPDAPDPWWLPARDLTVTDSWSTDPETLKVGETTRRIVTIEASGLLAEGLPPRPVMRTRGILTFAGPVSRETVVTPAGPVARATYQWDIKPAIDEVIPLEAIKIPWFDTLSRTMQEAEIPARQIGGGLPDRGEETGPAEPSLLGAAAAGLGAFGLGLALVGFARVPGRLRAGRPVRRALARAAGAGDAPAFRAAVERARSADPALYAAWRADPATAERLAALDRLVFGRDRGGEVDLAATGRLLSRSVRAPAVGVAARAALKPL